MQLNFSGIICISPTVSSQLPDGPLKYMRRRYTEGLQAAGASIPLTEETVQSAVHGFMVNPRTSFKVDGKDVGRIFFFNDDRYSDIVDFSTWQQSHEGNRAAQATSFLEQQILTKRQFNQAGSGLFYIG